MLARLCYSFEGALDLLFLKHSEMCLCRGGYEDDCRKDPLLFGGMSLAGAACPEIAPKLCALYRKASHDHPQRKRHFETLSATNLEVS